MAVTLKSLVVLSLLLVVWGRGGLAAELAIPCVADDPKTFCNPLNLDYCVSAGNPCRRDAADPVCVHFKGDYFLFATRAGGYWYSADFSHWTLLVPPALPYDKAAPAVFAYGDALYFMASGAGRLYRTENPKDPGSWQVVGRVREDTDPALFLDDDGRVYLYYGCSEGGPIWVVELDPKNQFKEISKPLALLRSNEKLRGWEVQGDHNRETDPAYLGHHTPWIEGPWMTKHKGTYYLQYAAPGTQYLTYGDGVCEAKSPTGPFTYAPYSPFSFKPTGFMAGAGHSCCFQDARKQWWHLSTGAVSVRHMFERRLALSPMWFDQQGRLVANTYRGDLPQWLPGQSGRRDGDRASNLAGWNLLSYGKSATASSAMRDSPVENAVDENIKTSWSARTGNPGEWLQVDLGGIKTVYALQVNFGEEDMQARNGRAPGPQYTIRCSSDGRTWHMLADKSANTRDAPHDYLELTGPLETRYLCLTNVAPASQARGKFAVRDLRVFGRGHGFPPKAVTQVSAIRDSKDPRVATVRWSLVNDAEGYLVSYGVAPDALHTHYEIRGATELVTHSLNAEVEYFFTVDAFNENGVSSPPTAPPIRLSSRQGYQLSVPSQGWKQAINKAPKLPYGRSS